MNKPAIFAALLVTATAVLAQSPTAATKRPGVSEGDPGEVVCVTQRETGSLTRRTRVCRTRAQWEEDRRANAQAMERVQAAKTTSGN